VTSATHTAIWVSSVHSPGSQCSVKLSGLLRGVVGHQATGGLPRQM
jgi:hypothetical protein